MSENKEMPAKNRIVHPRTELRWPPFHSNLLNEAFLTSVKGVFDEMLGRLYYGADKRKGWATAEPWKELTEHECRTCIRDSLAKGKLIDAMNYLMFAHLNGHKLLSLRNPSIDEPVSIDSQMRDQLANALGVTGRSWDEMLAMVGAVNAQAFEHQTTLETIAATLKLDFESSDESILSAIDTLVAPRPVEPEARQSADAGRNTHAKNTVTIKNEAAPDLFPEQRIKIKAGAKWPHVTLPVGAVEELKWSGLASAYDKAAEDCQGIEYEKFAPELRPSTTDTNDDLDLTMVADDSGIRSTLFRFKNEKDRDDYLPLLRTFLGALEQAAYGKGRERHANDLPFIEQPILTMAHMLDSDAGLAQQVIKKTIEARTLPTKQARINELRGTLVYAAAMILFEELYGRADDLGELDGDF
ncbi:hypothetical protein JT329_gp59 [Klebsiella phage KPN N98]|uniref:Uncharacterized protein n=5 Tax=Yonseivirus N137 TaxID=2845093 RepID=A0A286MMZ1_9CAUD|nr:hypothetical protein HWB25_gp59 [Klebsiella phage KPN N137]YP_009998449.1 hypothetical protein JT329_gp59 [Klebsiella phage KPN N98]YP_009998529.1 hypothetical protein JT330_gp60 [Klebsiella phage KPN U2874]ASW27521.1 hypothetical protein KPNN54_58 [Klebsiella phage KPN N54]ASW27599.1 hypothetical protein KPNN53_058 [Klebsiella phage YMC15/11/N53_KPN_BP]ASW27287.1 hypothetical protein KPNN137_59 [Klebsiella phage KPN N137]ASW27367.1 hypothetical protein KPNU2874_60 [Klebsiella phage KPN U2